MLIGLTGYAQHGKDTVGAYLVEHHGFTRFAFADVLKEMALVLNPIVKQYTFPKHPDRLATLVQLLGWEAAKQNTEVRRFLQVLGTEAGRGFLGDDVWVEALHRKMLDTNNWKGENAVITDVRFPNEAAAIEHWGGLLWRVVRTNPDGTSYDNGIGREHPSEAFVERIICDAVLVAHDIQGLQLEVEECLLQLVNYRG